MAIDTDKLKNGGGREQPATASTPVHEGAGDAMALALTASLEQQGAMIRGFVDASELSIDAAAMQFAGYIQRCSSGQRLLERTFEILGEQRPATIDIRAEVTPVELGIPQPSLGDGLARFRGLFGGSQISSDNPFLQLRHAEEDAVAGAQDD